LVLTEIHFGENDALEVSGFFFFFENNTKIHNGGGNGDGKICVSLHDRDVDGLRLPPKDDDGVPFDGAPAHPLLPIFFLLGVARVVEQGGGHPSTTARGGG
jgi:hypothetical protein